MPVALSSTARPLRPTARYYAESMKMSSGSDLSDRRREGSGKARFASIRIRPLDELGRPMEVAQPGCDLSIEVDLQCESNFAHANLAIIFYDSNGYRLIDANTAQKGEFPAIASGSNRHGQLLASRSALKPGKYLIGLWLGRDGVETVDHVEYATTLDFAEGEENSGHAVVYPGKYLCRFEENVSILQPSLTKARARDQSSGS